MVREIVVHRDAARDPAQLHATPDALERAQAGRHGVGAQASRGADGDRGKGVADVVGAEQRHLERAGELSLSLQVEGRGSGADLQVVGPPVGALGEAEGFDAAVRLRSQRPRLFVVHADEEQAAPRDQVHEPPERKPDRLQVRIDVGVVVLDVVDDGDVGQVLQELRGLVEERAVVLVPLDHEFPPAAHAIAAAEVVGDAADEHARIGAAVGQQPAGQ